MSNVYANGLEISGKSVNARTIAAFPDVCFTPPENPATPPGVPVPYPSFGFASDTENGTGTVKIGGKTVNIKNKSDLSRTSGTEAGCAAKKGIITSKNTGKGYFHSWSPNVKFDGEPVIRNTDLATDNHASPQGNTPPWVHIARMALAEGKCEKIYTDLQGHAHSKSPCDYEKTGRESEHTAQAACFLKDRSSGSNCKHWPDYNEGDAPCICMESKRIKKKRGERSKKDMPHYNKTQTVEDLLDKGRAGCMTPKGSVSCKKACVPPTTGELTKVGADATAEEHPKIQDKTPKEKKQISECLELINLTYLAGVEDADKAKDAKQKVSDVKKKKICMKGICKAPKSQKCHGC